MVSCMDSPHYRYDYLFKFLSSDHARASLPDFTTDQGWKSELILETRWFQDLQSVPGYWLLVQRTQGDHWLRSSEECLIELDRFAAIRGYVFIRMTRLSTAELRQGYFSPAFPGSNYPRPLAALPRDQRRTRVWRP